MDWMKREMEDAIGKLEEKLLDHAEKREMKELRGCTQTNV